MQNHLSLSELQRQIRLTLSERFPLPLWVSAEIADAKVNYSGHCYLELVEKGGDKGTPTAQARAVIWRSAYATIAQQFETQTGQRLTAGIRILAKVTVNFHELYGFSLQINDIDPAYTLGDMERQRQQTIAQLQKDGVWDMNRETELPPLVQRVAVISSAQAAGYRDFCMELASSHYRIDLQLFDAVMQGEAAEESIVGALCAVADQQELFDAVVIIRGGGSTSDLSCFNSYRLSSYIAQFPLPIITGIGHDKDTSIADMVAHTALKTPTAVAGWLIERMGRVDGWLDGAALQLHDLVQMRTKGWEMQIDRMVEQLRMHSFALLQQQNRALNSITESLPDAIKSFIERQQLRLSTAEQLATSHSPRRILQLGFAVVRNNGRAVKSVNELHSGDALEVEVADGRFTTEVK